MLVAAAIGFAVAGLGHFELPSVGAGGVPQVLPVAAQRTATPTVVSAAEAAVRDTITRANDAQAKAFTAGDDTLMRATATQSFYAQLVGTNADLRAAGVRAIELVDLSFDSVTVTGDTANAATRETWRLTYADGSAVEDTARNVYTLVLEDGAWKIDTDEQPDAAVTDPISPEQPSVTTPLAREVSTSSNWSGYAANGGSYTSVSGTWVVPTVSTTTSGADATWVGIGGLGSNDLIQAGTQATVAGGTVEYTAWTEMLPASSRTVPLTVAAGDTVTVTITERSPGVWDITIANGTTGQRYTTSVRHASTHASAEWIQEVPSVGRGLLPLDDFGTVRFTDASAVRDGQTVDLASSGAKAITMINNAGQALAQPSAIGADGHSFTVTRTSATAGGSGSFPQGRRRRG
jgi:hypothetical protein